ncbi:hypothetical protein ABKA04_007401 [Annulohypoxylon sp. FPYF3050]
MASLVNPVEVELAKGADEVEFVDGAEVTEEGHDDVVKLPPVVLADGTVNVDDPVPKMLVLVIVTQEVHVVFGQRAELLGADHTELLTWVEPFVVNEDANVDNGIEDVTPDDHGVAGVEVVEAFDQIELRVELRFPEVVEVIEAVVDDVILPAVVEKVEDALLFQPVCVLGVEVVHDAVVLKLGAEMVGVVVFEIVTESVIVVVISEAVVGVVLDTVIFESVREPVMELVDPGPPVVLVLVILAVNEEPVDEAEELEPEMPGVVKLDVNEVELDTLLAGELVEGVD